VQRSASFGHQRGEGIEIMRRYLISSGLIFFAAALGAQARDLPDSRYYSNDEYKLAHSMFDSIESDLNRAQTSVYPNDLAGGPAFNIAHNELLGLEQNWDAGRYDSRQIDNTISALRTVLDDKQLMRYDQEALARDLSRLLDFRSEYY
jgi:hypothetical protein